MTQIFVVEDNVFQREKILEIIAQVVEDRGYPFDLESDVWMPRDILQAIDDKALPNIYFLDIDLRLDKNGIDFARSLRDIDPAGYIIFVTSHSDRIKEIIDQFIAPHAYIVKDETDFQQIHTDIAKALENVKQRENIQYQGQTYHMEQPGMIMEIPYKDILYFETVPRAKKSILHTISDAYTINRYLKAIKTEFEAEPNFASFNSYLINLHHVTEVNRKIGIIKFTNDEELYGGRRIIDKFYQQYSTYKS
ncbi:response regulator transcription factor [Listeria booriae]|uniref:LytR/AlgR family response regulator transcription factor n=1 Tax=Listeria booriae TaxID=1552123 RepID=UPI00162A7470|nr:LytTR family DNA-binding domain-containing protein [Listeria booriae]MBC2147391.1 response regulator transcription factor [Listeria booriae]MBC2160846.1 response regulator transcription factor [Listeria booriae]MBC2173202.1 response regulator transcription factor [Listeria booriae]MBC2195689.1 response regulator transcription factor [Listeria booriae]